MNFFLYNIQYITFQLKNLNQRFKRIKNTIIIINKDKMDKDTQAQKFKVVFLGNQSVGKTPIISRMNNGNFDGDSSPSIGVDFCSKTLIFNEKLIRIQIWDTAGQERFRSLIPSYIKDSSAAVICYDITNEKSFQDVEKWIYMVQELTGDQTLIYILGNKIDLEENRKIKMEEAKAKVQKFGHKFYEVSAKNGHNIPEFLNQLAADLLGNAK
ncbi:unnamed protein product [Paramecium sonneborni]|uniref:P-loop containing nucleoside triphosphate hydrolase n=1 Tax=Paramecium sonneborni TaxID=65129 RepID=A0A8S1PC08_9CILI|nr:unnamed protein product [Paramecium sonneborni]